MQGRIAALYRHPVKGFTPEPLARARLEAGAHFPNDRMFAIENGPSDFDADDPRHVSKFQFAVLATLPQLVRVRTRFDERTAVLHVAAENRPERDFGLATAEGRRDFAAWVEGFVGRAELGGPLKLNLAPGHRFTDNAQGHVSLINLESLRDFERKVGRKIDVRRFRANILVEGWPAWSEFELVKGAAVGLGSVRLRGFKKIVRCIATHADPDTGERNLDVCGQLMAHYGHAFLGIYLNVSQGGEIGVGDEAVTEHEPTGALELVP
jgi:uncharacterized protein YcbX